MGITNSHEAKAKAKILIEMLDGKHFKYSGFQDEEERKQGYYINLETLHDIDVFDIDTTKDGQLIIRNENDKYYLKHEYYIDDDVNETEFEVSREIVLKIFKTLLCKNIVPYTAEMKYPNLG